MRMSGSREKREKKMRGKRVTKGKFLTEFLSVLSKPTGAKLAVGFLRPK